MQVADKLRESLLDPSNPLIGAMCWMVATENYPGDIYKLHPRSVELPALTQLCRDVNTPWPS
jgi:hypothetical protein